MGIFIPDLSEITQIKDGERYLLEMLKEVLDDTYEIYYKPILNGDIPDVVILKKNGGVLIIEVKDFSLSDYNINKKCKFMLKKNGKEIKSPVEQTLVFKQNFLEMHIGDINLRAIKRENIKNVVQTAIYFHNDNKEDLIFLMKNKESNVNILGKSNLNKESIKRLIKLTGMDGMSTFFDDFLYNEVKKALNPKFKFKSNIEFLLDKKQRSLSKSTSTHTKIKGISGTGKTVVLAERAANCFERTRGKILVLTYNIALKNFLEERIGAALKRKGFSEDVRKNFVIINYHQFIKSQANNLGIKIGRLKKYDDIHIFNSVNLDDYKYDGIFIDEVQDFKYIWLKLVKENFLKKGGEYVLTCDENQNIYKRDIDLEGNIVTNIKGAWNILEKTYRFNGEIQNLTSRFKCEYMDKNDFEKNDIAKINSIEYEILDSEDDYDKIAYNIQRFIKENDMPLKSVGVIVSENHIVKNIEYILRNKYKINSSIMCETKDEGELIKKERGINSIRRSKKYKFRLKNKNVKLSTIQSFKGLEIENLILIYNDECSTPENMYVSITRAKSKVYIMGLNTKKYNEFFLRYKTV